MLRRGMEQVCRLEQGDIQDIEQHLHTLHQQHSLNKHLQLSM